jgi:hypothetical protein
MVRTLTVIRLPNGTKDSGTCSAQPAGFLEDFEYSQGYRSETLTPDVLKAKNFEDSDDAASAHEMYLDEGAVIETYKVTITKL